MFPTLVKLRARGSGNGMAWHGESARTECFRGGLSGDDQSRSRCSSTLYLHIYCTFYIEVLHCRTYVILSQYSINCVVSTFWILLHAVPPSTTQPCIYYYPTAASGFPSYLSYLTLSLSHCSPPTPGCSRSDLSYYKIEFSA